jgi:hypothetical protein
MDRKLNCVTVRTLCLLVQVALLVIVVSRELRAQGFTTDDSVIHRIWELGMEGSQAEELAQILTDFIGPRLHGSPNLANAQDWLLETYIAMHIPARLPDELHYLSVDSQRYIQDAIRRYFEEHLQPTR